MENILEGDFIPDIFVNRKGVRKRGYNSGRLPESDFRFVSDSIFMPSLRGRATV